MSRYVAPEDTKQAYINMVIGLLVLMPVLWLIGKHLMQVGDNSRKQLQEYYSPALADYQQGDYTDSEKLLDTYLNIENTNPYANYLQGLCQLRTGASNGATYEFQESMNRCYNYYSTTQYATSSANAHHLHDDAQQMLDWVQENPGNTTPPAGAEDFSLLQSIER